MIIKVKGIDAGIRTLLDLNDQIIDQENGYWIKITAWEVKPCASIPHGIRYALTLHAPSGKRILGYDNAHSVISKSKKFTGNKLTYDHKHRRIGDIGIPYIFVDAHQLLSDFFSDVDRALKEINAQ